MESDMWSLKGKIAHSTITHQNAVILILDVCFVNGSMKDNTVFQSFLFDIVFQVLQEHLAGKVSWVLTV